MAIPQRPPAAPAGAVLLSGALLGALAGAGGLAWWLWRHSRQRPGSAENSLPLLSRRREPLAPAGRGWDRARAEALPDRVQQLNQAIEDVRRQLESLQSHP